MKRIFLFTLLFASTSVYSQTDLLWRDGQTSTPSTTGKNILSLQTPAGTRYLQLNSDGTVTVRTAGELVADIGASSSTHTHSGVDLTSGSIPAVGVALKFLKIDSIK